eukprot:TRINITY_DN2165_c0_g1_i4.p1 TRINITY_DN2165_c0_g1~~TRINITY_DN2165_c0_g1_i4.p1  ORF type:complete len:241 (+),score=49.78 TRINITY_DN2165_c0_g1_i4:106-828(+)
MIVPVVASPQAQTKRQRPDLQTYHGYGIQDFLEVEPRFGTRRDLRSLVDAAHRLGLYVLLDVVYNHSGNNFFYKDGSGQPADTLPYRFSPPYEIAAWRSAKGLPVGTIETRDDGVWPREFQQEWCYTRAGEISHWDCAPGQDWANPANEWLRGDFFDLKDMKLCDDGWQGVLELLIKVYQYWIAVSDCDGMRIDSVKHVPLEASRRFCGAIHEYAESIGKHNFLLLGEITGGPQVVKGAQ